MKRLALIPARGGSKRLPRKNVKDFLGKPIIGYTIDAALETKLFDRVIVSTDDPEIAVAASRSGAIVADRRAELARDDSTVVDVCLDVLDREERAGHGPDVLCVLLATAPLRTAEDIRRVVALLEPGVCDFAMAVSRYDLAPFQALTPAADGALVPVWVDLIEKSRQEVPEMFCDNGSTYAVVVSAFRARRTFYGSGLRGFVMPRLKSVDIDTSEDFAIAEMYAASLWKAASA